MEMMAVPIFTGVSVELQPWLEWLERYFAKTGDFTDDEKLQMAWGFISGEAEACSVAEEIWDTWETLKHGLLLQFGEATVLEQVPQRLGAELEETVTVVSASTTTESELEFFVSLQVSNLPEETPESKKIVGGDWASVMGKSEQTPQPQEADSAEIGHIAEPEATVTVTIDSTPVKSVVANMNGNQTAHQVLDEMSFRRHPMKCHYGAAEALFNAEKIDEELASTIVSEYGTPDPDLLEEKIKAIRILENVELPSAVADRIVKPKKRKRMKLSVWLKKIKVKIKGKAKSELYVERVSVELAGSVPKRISRDLVPHWNGGELKKENLMINDDLNTVAKLQKSLTLAVIGVSAYPKHTPYETLAQWLKEMGFEKGWGDTTERLKETMVILSEVLEAPDNRQLDFLFSRLPTMFNVVIFSVHGYFGQQYVLELPDTGGQVVCILDQVRTGEEELLIRINQQDSGFKPQILVVTRVIPEARGTNCDQELEAIEETKHAHILRVPFVTDKGILRHWVSRFNIYPYLERFTQDATSKILQRLDCKPDLIIGNYTDGNWGASLMATKLGVTQETIAHAWEKTKNEDFDAQGKVLDPNISFAVEDALVAADFKGFNFRTRDSLSCWSTDSLGFNLTENVLCHIVNEERPGAVLVFMNGWDDINSLKNQLEAHPLLGDPNRVLLLAYHGSMVSSEQRLIFDRPPEEIRKIVLATNMAETSITINDVVFVIAWGKAKETSYDALNNNPCLLPTWISKAAAHQRRGRAGRVRQVFYGLMLKWGDEYLKDLFVVSSAISTYVELGDLESARKVFDSGVESNIEGWNTMIGIYVQNDCLVESIELFLEAIGSKEILSAAVTFLLAASAVSALQQVELCRQFHGFVAKNFQEILIVIFNSLMVLYSRCGSVYESFGVYDSMRERDVVSWNTMISAFVQKGLDDEGLLLVHEMQKQGFKSDYITVTALLSAVSNLRNKEAGKQTHGFLIRQGIQFEGMNSYLIDMYVKSGLIRISQKLLERSGYAEEILSNEQANVTSTETEETRANESAELHKQYNELGKKHSMMMAGIREVPKASSNAAMNGRHGEHFANAFSAEFSAIRPEKEKERKRLKKENQILANNAKVEDLTAILKNVTAILKAEVEKQQGATTLLKDWMFKFKFRLFLKLAPIENTYKGNNLLTLELGGKLLLKRGEYCYAPCADKAREREILEHRRQLCYKTKKKNGSLVTGTAVPQRVVLQIRAGSGSAL